MNVIGVLDLWDKFTTGRKVTGPPVPMVQVGGQQWFTLHSNGEGGIIAAFTDC